MPLNMANPNTLNQFTVVLVYDTIELLTDGATSFVKDAP